MKVYNCGELIVDIQLNSTCVNLGGIIDDGNNILLPYEDREFLTSIASLFDDVVSETKPLWKEPDYEKSKCYFYIIGDQIELLVEALPKCYTVKEKKLILQAANQSIRKDGYSDYCEMLDRFDIIDNIVNTQNPMGEMCLYQLEMSAIEREVLFLTYE